MYRMENGLYPETGRILGFSFKALFDNFKIFDSTEYSETVLAVLFFSFGELGYLS